MRIVFIKIMQAPNNLQNAIQFELLNKFRTGNPVYDAIISTLIFSTIAALIGRITSIFSGRSEIITRFKYALWYFPIKITNIFKRKMIRKDVVIDYITDTKKINELFQAVQYFVANNDIIDYVSETPLKITYEKKIDQCVSKLDDVKNIKLNKFIIHNKTKSFTYKGKTISYYINKDIITVYADKERKKENYTITLSTDVPFDYKFDIIGDFCTHCLTEYIKNIVGQIWTQKIYVNKNGNWESQISNNKRKIDTIVLRNGDKQEIMNDIDMFLHSEEWYNVRDIPYTRGYLFYGKPGTGKTSMIKGISNYYKRHIHFLMLRDIKDDHELLDLMRQINYHETILVIEDIDCTIDAIKNRKDIVHENNKLNKIEKEIEILQKKMSDVNQNQNQCQDGRIEVLQQNQKRNELTLSGLLNAIDGVFNNDGRILIMTTNHPEVLDDALIRPGRIDRKFLFDNCDKKQITELYEVFFNEKCDIFQLDHIPDYEYSPAYISSLFLRFRNKSKEALMYIDKNDDIQTIKPLILVN